MFGGQHSAASEWKQGAEQPASGVEDGRHDEQRGKTSSEKIGERRSESEVQTADSIEGSTLEANTQRCWNRREECGTHS